MNKLDVLAQIGDMKEISIGTHWNNQHNRVLLEKALSAVRTYPERLKNLTSLLS